MELPEASRPPRYAAVVKARSRTGPAARLEGALAAASTARKKGGLSRGAAAEQQARALRLSSRSAQGGPRSITGLMGLLLVLGSRKVSRGSWNREGGYVHSPPRPMAPFLIGTGERGASA